MGTGTTSTAVAGGREATGVADGPPCWAVCIFPVLLLAFAAGRGILSTLRWRASGGAGPAAGSDRPGG